MEYAAYPVFINAAAAQHDSPWDYIASLAREAENLGYSYFGLGDRMARSLDVFSILTVAASATTHIKLATSVAVLPPRGPLSCATAYEGLNILSGGRVIAGVGTSSQFYDWQAAALERDDMWPRFNESVKALRAYLSPNLPPFKGKYYDTEGFNLQPDWAQTAPIPIWIGSWGSDAGLRRVARLGDGWFGSSGPGRQSPEQFGKDKLRLEAMLVKEGKDPSTFPNAISSMAMFVSDDQDELERISAPAGGNQQQPGAGGLARPAERPFEDEHAHDMIGTPAQCIEKVRRWQEAGAGALFLNPRGPDPVGQWRTFIDKVASKV